MNRQTPAVSMSVRRRILVVVAVASVLLSVFVTQPASAIVYKDFNFDGCYWRAAADDTGAAAITQTFDVNSGCSYLDADVYYIYDYQYWYKWCAAVNSWINQCSATGGIHESSRSQAKSWETDRWQSSGWWA